MIKRFIVVAAFCGLLFGGLVWFNNFRAAAIADFFANRQIPPVTVSAAEVTRQTWPDYLRAIGTIQAVEGVELAPQVAGIVKSITFKPNDSVEAGQLLIQLDDAVEQANIALYEAQLRLAQRTLERVSTLRSRGNAADASYDEAVAQVDQTRAQLEQTRAIIDQKSIEAPFDGIVGIERVNQGQFVTAGTPLVTLQRLDRVHVDFSLPEAHIGKVQLGQKVELEIDAYPGRTFSGEITGIDPRLSATSRTLSIRATLDNPDGALRPGVFARVAVVLPERPDVLTVPQTAISFRLYGDTVFVINEVENEGGEPSLVVEQKFVRVGQRRGNVAEILEGLEAGQRVVTSGQLKLQNGYPVAIDNSIDPAQFVFGS